MAINTACLETNLQTQIDGFTCATAPEDLLSAASSARNLTSDIESYVALGCELPDLNEGKTPVGSMFYVDELGIPVVAGYQSWLSIDGRTYRKDVPDFSLFSWGNDSAGRLGYNKNGLHTSSPVQEFSSSTIWCMTAAGYCNTWAIKRDGTLWGVGCNNDGRLGTGSNANASSPTQEATSSTNWCYVGGSPTRHGAALKSDGSVFSYGCNGNGQLGTDNIINTSSPVREITSSCWSMVSAGGYHTAGIKSSGEIWSWGRNINGVLGANLAFACSTSSPVQEASSSTNWCCIESGQDISIALKTDGSYWTWGYNFYGSTGINCTIVKSSPVQEMTSSTNWCVVSAQLASVGGVKTDGTLWNWGYNAFGQLGRNNTVCYSSPVQELTSGTSWCDIGIGRQHTLGIKTDGTLWGWGQQTSVGGTLADGTIICRSSPVQEISSATNWKEVKGGAGHTVAIKSII